MNRHNSSRVVLIGHYFESSLLDHRCELWLLREFPDTLNKILVRVFIVGQELSHDGDSMEAVVVVDLFEPWHNHL